MLKKWGVENGAIATVDESVGLDPVHFGVSECRGGQVPTQPAADGLQV